MHIFRWLMSHPIITAWILAALAILLNINMGSNSGAEQGGNNVASHVVESGEGVVAETSSQAHRITDTAGSIEKSAKVSHEHGNASSAMHQPVKAISKHSHSTAPDAVAVKSVAAPAQVAASTLSTNTTNVVEEKQSSDAVEVDASKRDNAPSAIASEEATEDLIAMSSEDLLKLAREAFWQNKKDKSAAIYQALVKRDPSSLAYKGELANVLWHQNKQKESAALYAEIAMPLLKEGKSREVANMLGFIGVFFPEKASEIHRSMSE
ncbi:MAG: hypothetical protein V3U78_07850 [Thiotrichaceae bacterium]